MGVIACAGFRHAVSAWQTSAEHQATYEKAACVYRGSSWTVGFGYSSFRTTPIPIWLYTCADRRSHVSIPSL